MLKTYKEFIPNKKEFLDTSKGLSHEKLFSCAQKILIIDIKNPKKIRLLLGKYIDATYLSIKLKGKYCLPGGQFEFGQTPEENAKQEVFEETGVEVEPSFPLDIWTWVYEKNGIQKQIVATSRIAIYKKGTPKPTKEDGETKLGLPEWIDIEKLKNLISKDKIVDDEINTFNKFINLFEKGILFSILDN